MTASKDTFKQGPYNLGRWSILNGWVASVFLVATSICFFFPTSFNDQMQQEADSFNYTCVVYGGALIVAGAYWFLSARHFFKGPIRPEDVAEMEFKEIKLMKKRKSEKEPENPEDGVELADMKNRNSKKEPENPEGGVKLADKFNDVIRYEPSVVSI